MKVTQRKVGWGTQATALRRLRHLARVSGHSRALAAPVSCHSTLSTSQEGQRGRPDVATGWTLDTLDTLTG